MMTSLIFSLPITDPTGIFFVVVLIMLLAPLIFERLRIPQIVGMILAGVLIGPYGLNLLTRDASFELFGQVGLYYIMFLAGLSMDTGALKRDRFQVLSFGFLSFALPFAAGLLISVYILGMNLATSVLTACILASHTMVSYSIVANYGLSKYKGVTLGIVATMVSLVLSLMVLAGLVGSFKGNSGWTLWGGLILKSIIYLTALFYIYPRVIRFFFRKISDDVLQYIFVIALVFLSALASQALGLEGVLGAFFAGMILNRYIPEATPLMRHIEFMGNALFIPYFLIGVGMLINFGQLVSSAWSIIFVSMICLVALGSKWLAAFLTARLFRLNNKMRRMMTGLTTGHAAGALAMLVVGREIEISPGIPLVNDLLMGAIVTLILVSCIYSAIVTTSASKAIAPENISEEEKLGEEDKILVALSNPKTTTELVNLSLIMRPHRSTTPLVGVKLVVDAADNERELDSARKMVKDAAQQAASAGINMKKVVRSGVNIITALTYTMKDFDASEIIMGYHWEDGSPAKSFGSVITGLLSSISRQIIIANLARPVNTLRRIHVVVPANAELEVGFQRWLMHVSRLARQLDCQIIFYCSSQAWELIETFCHRHYKNNRQVWIAFNEFERFPELKETIHDDHLLVLISARQHSLSYQSVFLDIPDLLQRYFPLCSKMIIFPDQYGIENKMVSFSTGFPYNSN